jgi:hypothetical protein
LAWSLWAAQVQRVDRGLRVQAKEPVLAAERSHDAHQRGQVGPTLLEVLQRAAADSGAGGEFVLAKVAGQAQVTQGIAETLLPLFGVDVRVDA